MKKKLRYLTLSIVGLVLVCLIFISLSSYSKHKASFDTNVVSSSKQDSTNAAWWAHTWSVPDKKSSSTTKKFNPRKTSVTNFSNDANTTKK